MRFLAHFCAVAWSPRAFSSVACVFRTERVAASTLCVATLRQRLTGPAKTVVKKTQDSEEYEKENEALEKSKGELSEHVFELLGAGA